MRKRIRTYILAAAVGAVLGFGVQLGVDFFRWRYPGDLPPNWNLARSEAYTSDGTLEIEFSKRNMQQARGLLYQAAFLYLLQQKGDAAARTGLLCAFIAVTAVLAREHFQQNRESMPSLSSIPPGERNKYHLLDDGRRIEWLDGTVSIDIDDVRYSTEPAFRFQENMRALNRYGLCGEAIRSLRSETPRALIEKRGGPSIKHQARIETDSQPPTRNMLVKLAKAHKMTMEGYVKQLLKESDRLEAGKLKAKLAKKPARKS